VAFPQRFAVTLPFGACAGVALPDAAPPEAQWPAALHAGERAFAAGLPEARRASWIGGRLALRAALEAAGLSAGDAILATDRGAPRLPEGVTGSISHKADLAVAVAGRPPASVGVDLERIRPLRADISTRVLTPRERAALPAAGVQRDGQVLRAFSAKEAIYKALDPWVRRYIGFQEVEIAFGPDGALAARLALTGGEGPFAIELIELAGLAGTGHMLTVAVARPG
jgi:4'-phosphopantetheinyl transferase EntD